MSILSGRRRSLSGRDRPAAERQGAGGERVREEAAAIQHQKMYFSANCMMRGPAWVAMMRPKLALP
jgi:hypothetical protein